jgi:N-acetyl sugar amidotransferase
LEQLVEKIKKDGKGKPYDCIMGLSGGVDSSYVAYLCKQYNLRPLAVHFDNGWNSELAVKNIESMVNKCGFDLYTLVVDWEEFRDIQLSYLKASVVDIEVPTDHAITTVLMRLALKHKIKYSLSGSNVNTEFIMPKSWIFNKSDHINLLDIHKQFGTKPIKTYPLNDTMLKKRYTWAGIQSLNILNYVDYHKQNAKDIITKELGWRDYGGKHYESLFTKFYQAHILPEKFSIDKRKPHLTNMIFSGEISKAEAVEELQTPLYAPEVFQLEKEFFLKKLGLSAAEWEAIMKKPAKSHYDFATERPLDERYKILKPAKYIFSKLMKN